LCRSQLSEIRSISADSSENINRKERTDSQYHCDRNISRHIRPTGKEWDPFIQAYVFTMLSAVFIGLAQEGAKVKAEEK